MLTTAKRRWREARMVAKGLQSGRHPVLAQIVPIRRCNLACAYCNEFDDHSAPVPLDAMLERIDHLARLGTSRIELSGGEPLLHPDLDAIIQRIRQHGALAGLITNGYLLSEKRIARLNEAGLDHLQISIDNVVPDDTSKKSLKVLDRKLQMLAHHASFGVNVNSVLGAELRIPEDALTIARRARDLGLTATVGLIHDAGGTLVPLAPGHYRVYNELARMTAPFYTVQNQNDFQRNLALGQPNDWHCSAGGRYLYICEDGLVHWCSQQRGHPGIPLADYTPADVEREAATPKTCAPLCTVSCVHRVALLDRLRTRPLDTLEAIVPPDGRAPASVRVLRWMFVTSRHRDRFRRLAARLLVPGARSRPDVSSTRLS
jgi:MoaA/NifB/PqqE/SkfB family radical SAM enzyme